MSTANDTSASVSIDSLSNSDEVREAVDEVRREKAREHESMQDLDETRQSLEDTQQTREPSTIDEKVDAVLDEYDDVIPAKGALTKGTTVLSEATDENIRAHCPNGIGNTALEERLNEVAETPSTRRLLNHLAGTLSEWIVDEEYDELHLVEEYNARDLSAIHQELRLGGNLRQR